MSKSICFTKTLGNAVTPTKAGIYEVGFDLTAIEEVKKYGKNTTMYDTGICVCPEDGYYTEIVARSSIVKTGHVLSNSVGIIDPTYRGSLKICLTKVDDSMPSLELPFKLTQLIIRPFIDGRMIELSKLPDSYRGDGGFGSTNV
jgi:dUTP pyrophosphatase